MEGDGETKLECPTTQFTPAAAPKFVEMESMNAHRVSSRNIKIAPELKNHNFDLGMPRG